MESSGFIASVDSTSIFFSHVGPAPSPTVPTVIFIPGLWCSTSIFDPLFSDPRWVQSGFHLVRYDLRGHGRSGKPVDPSMYDGKRLSGDLVKVCEAVGVSEGCQVFLAPWSIAGVIPTHFYASSPPFPLAGVVQIAGIPWMQAMHVVSPEILATAGGALSLDPVEQQKGYLGFIESLVLNGDSDHINCGKLGWKAKMEALGAAYSIPPAVRSVYLAGSTDPVPIQNLDHVLPTLLVHGQHDKHRKSPEAVTDVFKPHFPDLEVVTLDSGHAVFIDQPEEFADRVLDWLRRKSIGEVR
ncbi:alpha/beta-hydrolase [Atractiella rhizophila]|nr:alpha/beta-hydrolase [Atractiella rhizophila]